MMAKVIILTTNWGHLSIAKAIRQVLIKNSIQVDLYKINDELLTRSIYSVFYRFFPGMFKRFFDASNNKTAIIYKVFNFYVEGHYKKKLMRIFSDTKPDIVINTYFQLNPQIEKLTSIYPFKYYNYITDPRTFSKILVSNKATNLVFDAKSIKRMEGFSRSAKKIVSGWFVGDEFYKMQNFSREEVRANLDLDPSKFTICITSGSGGTFDILKVIRSIINKDLNTIQIIFMCGSNESMYRAVLGLKSLSAKINGPTIIGVPFTNRICEYFRSSNIVVGKAGPNTLFESVATLTPFLAVSHVSGQEDGNLDIIREYNVGYIEENPKKIDKILKDISKRPEQLNKFAQNLKSLSNYCQNQETNFVKNLLK